jgi:hypothetical protein
MNWMHRLIGVGVVAAVMTGADLQPGLSQSSPQLTPEAQLEPPPAANRGFFLSPPRLVDAETTFSRVAYSNAIYFFIVEIPDNAGSPLQQLQIAQRDASTHARRVEYELEDTQAFFGTPDDRGDDLNLSNTQYDRQSQTLTVRFEPPIPPGTILTLRLRPERNPRMSGVYLFGVTAYPTGTPERGQERGQFLGYGRLHFYDSDSAPIF